MACTLHLRLEQGRTIANQFPFVTAESASRVYLSSGRFDSGHLKVAKSSKTEKRKKGQFTTQDKRVLWEKDQLTSITSINSLKPSRVRPTEWAAASSPRNRGSSFFDNVLAAALILLISTFSPTILCFSCFVGALLRLTAILMVSSPLRFAFIGTPAEGHAETVLKIAPRIRAINFVQVQSHP